MKLTIYPGFDHRITVLGASDEVDAVFVRMERFKTLATPLLCRQALALIADHIGYRSLLTVNSHMDWDHLWGNVALNPEVPIYAHDLAPRPGKYGKCRVGIAIVG